MTKTYVDFSIDGGFTTSERTDDILGMIFTPIHTNTRSTSPGMRAIGVNDLIKSILEVWSVVQINLGYTFKKIQVISMIFFVPVLYCTVQYSTSKYKFAPMRYPFATNSY